jgi:hypothetical protein
MMQARANVMISAKKIIPLLIFALAAFVVGAEENSLDRTLLQGTVRIRYERMDRGTTISGHGTAFGVELSQYGLTGRRFLLSAAHNVLDEKKHPYNNLKVELRDGNRVYWTACRPVAWDEYLDLCLLECGEDLRQLLRLDENDSAVGCRIALAGSPRDTPVAIFNGIVTQRFERGTARSEARVTFDHGDSGGPVVSRLTGKVAGVAVAGLPKDGDLDHNIGLFVPVAAVCTFLENNRRGEAKAAAIMPPANQLASVADELQAAPAPTESMPAQSALFLDSRQ